jgi:hypothetical protein
MASCLIYTASCVSTLNCYYYITNNFAGGIFKSVSKISLFDEKPFEHDFFMEISKSFPFVKTLSITNTTQVDGSVKRILPEPRGNEIYSG